MKKFISVLLLVFLLTPYIKSQTVDSIKVEQTGDYIKIRYKILNSTPAQVYKVKVLCSINGGMNTEIRSISGDVGDMIAGGKSDYWVVWDVLKDVDEIKSVEFIVRAELLKENTISGKSGTKEISKNKFNVFLVTDIIEGRVGQKFGGRLGYLGSWGISAMFIKGKEYSNSSFANADVSRFTGSLDLTKRIVNNKSFKLHLYTGVIFANLLYEGYNIYGDMYGQYHLSTSIEGGFIWSINKLAFSFGTSFFQKEREDEKLHGSNGFGYVGLGWRF